MIMNTNGNITIWGVLRTDKPEVEVAKIFCEYEQWKISYHTKGRWLKFILYLTWKKLELSIIEIIFKLLEEADISRRR